MRYCHLFLVIVGLCTMRCNSLFGAPPTAFVTTTEDETVVPIDTSTNTTGTAIVFSPTDELLFIAITPDGLTAYVTENTTDVVHSFNTATGAIGPDIIINALPSNSSEGIAITPDGTTMYITNPLGNSVTSIDLTTNPPTVGVTLTSGFSTPIGVAISPDGLTAYVMNNGANYVTPINIATNTPGAPILVGLAPFDMGITPDGLTAYVTDTNSNAITPIDLTTNPPTPGTPIPLPFLSFAPLVIAITPDGTTAYVTNEFSNNITPIDLTTNTAGTSIPIGNTPMGIAITPNGKTAYVALEGDVNTIPVDLTTNPATPGTPIFTGNGPWGVAITPDQAPTAIFTFTIGAVGSPTSFDASSSFSPEGTIALYAWDFGDGTMVTTTSPTISHVYNAPGNYLVILTVTNSTGTSTTVVSTGHMVLRNGGPSARTSHLLNISTSSLLSPPMHFKGKRCKNKFAAQTEYFNFLSWKPSSNNAGVIKYLLSRNGKLIAKIPARGPFKFKDHNRNKNKTYFYELVAVYAQGMSQPATLTLPSDKSTCGSTKR
jgi:YVTN family beta-propeller protein